jgi:hypothetical protein
LKSENIEILPILSAAILKIAAIRSPEELIGNDENCIQGHFYFQNSRQQNRQNFTVL